MFCSQYMSSLRAMTDQPAVLLAVNTHATLDRARARVPTSAYFHTRVLFLSLHAPAVDCPWNDERVADGGAFMYLY